MINTGTPSSTMHIKLLPKLHEISSIPTVFIRLSFFFAVPGGHNVEHSLRGNAVPCLNEHCPGKLRNINAAVTLMSGLLNGQLQ